MKRILIVDDEIDLVKLIRFRMKKAGYEILTAYNGSEGLAIIQQEKPDLVLLDLNLPMMLGSEVCTIVKADPEIRHIPIVLLSASAENLKERARQIGADASLVKPFEHQTLIEIIARLVNQGGNNDE
ncbi:MAG: response regulator [bacterium]